MTLEYSRASLADLENARSYISNNLKNCKAATKLLNEIVQSCKQLKDFPNLGRPLIDPDGTITNYRLLVIRNQIVIYEIIEDTVRIHRILDGRTDYLRMILNQDTDIVGIQHDHIVKA